MNKNQTPEQEPFTITYDDSIVDVTNLEAALQAQEALQRAETEEYRIARVKQLLGTSTLLTGRVLEHVGYAVVNSEKAVRWLGREMLADALGNKDYWSGEDSER